MIQKKGTAHQWIMSLNRLSQFKGQVQASPIVSGDHSIPPDLQDDFEDYSEEWGAVDGLTGLHNAGTSNQHIHCEWESDVYALDWPDDCPDIP